MSAWRDRVEELLYEGETVEDHVEWAEASVVVTSHRVLAFTPDVDGPNFSRVDRPNVEGVTTGARSEAGLLERGIRYGVIGAVLVVAGWVIDFEQIIGDVSLGGSAAGQVGLGGIMGAMRRLLGLMRQLDDLMQLFGALGLLLSAVLVGVYWYTREPTLSIQVAGGEDIHVPRPDEDTTARLQGVLTPERTESSGAFEDLL